MELDDVLVNLKVLEGLQVNQKLISRDKHLNVEYNSMVPEWIRRWRRNDSRDEAINKINITIDRAIVLQQSQKPQKTQQKKPGEEQIVLNYMENSDDSYPDINEVMDNNHSINTYLQRSIKGLENLKETYSICGKTKARIDVIIRKIEQNNN